MSTEALLSRMAAVIINYEREVNGNIQIRPEHVVALGPVQMRERIVKAGMWPAFVDKYGVRYERGNFYDSDGLIEPALFCLFGSRPKGK